MTDVSHLFVSYSTIDNVFVERLRADLQAAGVFFWIDKVGLKAGTPDWEDALRTAVGTSRGVLLIASPNSRKSRYVRDELAIADMHDKPVFPVWADGDVWIDSIPIGLGYTQNVDLRGDRYTRGLEQLLQVLRGEGKLTATEEHPVIALPETPPTTPTTATSAIDIPMRNPYKGLRAFRQSDHGDFFGREGLIQALLDALQAHPFLAVIGASGSGKSSAVMAGLLPAMQRGALPGSENWVYLDPVMPGARPMENLTVTLAKHIDKSARTLREDLDDPQGRGLHLLAKQLTNAPEQRTVLVIDQFEELFTQTTDANERQQFINLVTTAMNEPTPVLVMIITLRADFYDRPLNFVDLGQLITEHHLSVLPMSLADLYSAVQGPARLPDVQLTFDEALVAELVFAVRDEAGGLPLLQFALDQLYRRAAVNQQRRLTWDAYRAIGELRGALAQHAEQTFQNLPDEAHRQRARDLFLRLIEPGITEQDTTRRRAMQSELTLADPALSAVMEDVVRTFTEQRLLIADHIANEDTIEVAHEALIREWERLRNWLVDAREDIIRQKKIAADALAWVREGSPVDYGAFYRGEILTEAEAWASHSSPSADESAFLIASKADQDRRAAHEQKIARRVANFQRASVVLLGASIIATLSALTAFYQFNEARNARNAALEIQAAAEARADEAQQQVAIANATLGPLGQIVANAQAEATRSTFDIRNARALMAADQSRQQFEAGLPQTALLLALESLRDYPSVFNIESYNALVNALSSPIQEAFFFQYRDAASGARWSNDETRLLSWSREGVIRIDPLLGTQGEPIVFRSTGPVFGAVWSTDETRILSWGGDNNLAIWTVGSETPLLLDQGARPLGAVWSQGDNKILSWGRDGSVLIWSLDRLDSPLRLMHEAPPLGAAWNADETRVLSWSQDGTARIWFLDGSAEPVLLPHGAVVYGAQWSDDERRILTWSADGFARIWPLDTPDTPLELPHNGQSVNGARWSNDQTSVLTWSSDNRVRIWTLASPAEPVVLLHDSLVSGAVWSPDEARVLTWSDDGTARVWVSDGSRPPLVLPHDGVVNGGVWSQSENKVLTWSEDGTTRLWSLSGSTAPMVLIQGSGVAGARLSLRDTYVLAWLRDGKIRIWRIDGSAEPRVLQHPDEVNSARVSTDAGRVLTAAADGVVRVWSLGDLVNTRRQLVHNNRQVDARWNSDETRVLSWSGDGVVHVWVPDSDEGDLTFQHDGAVLGAVWSADERRILSWAFDDTARIWPIDGGEPVILRHQGAVNSAVWSGDETRVLTASGDRQVRIWTTDGSSEPVALTLDSPAVGAVWSPDETRVLAWSESATLYVWTPGTDTPPLTIESLRLIFGASWSPDGQRIASWYDDGVLAIRPADGSSEPLQLQHQGWVLGTQWSTDGTRILSWSDDSGVRVWQTGDGALLNEVHHFSAVFGAVWSPDETRVLSWSEDDTARVWTLDGSTDPLILRHNGSVTGAAWDQAGTSVISWSADGTARVWKLDVELLIARGRELVIRQLNETERDRFFLPPGTE